MHTSQRHLALYIQAAFDFATSSSSTEHNDITLNKFENHIYFHKYIYFHCRLYNTVHQLSTVAVTNCHQVSAFTTTHTHSLAVGQRSNTVLTMLSPRCHKATTLSGSFKGESVLDLSNLQRPRKVPFSWPPFTNFKASEWNLSLTLHSQQHCPLAAPGKGSPF